MIILTIRTDKKDAEIGLYDDETQIAYETWEAHRALAETLHIKINAMLQSYKKDWHDIEGVMVYQGPGSFTGLRIGISVANALAYALSVPIKEGVGDDWLSKSLEYTFESDKKFIVPFYGVEAIITSPTK